MKKMLHTLRNFIKESALKNLDYDDPKARELHKQIILKKPLLYEIYSNFYHEFRHIAQKVPQEGLLVEIGSGGGFIKKFIPTVITSDIIDLPDIDKVFSAEKIEFNDSSVSAFFLLNVFHHIKSPRKFIYEVQRCLKPNGELVLIEPSNTFWGRFIRKNIHHEPYDTSAGWELDGSRPMSDCNLALPWIVFIRDRNTFEKEFPHLKIIRYESKWPLKYLLSGGINYKSIIPSFLIPLVRFAEHIISPLNQFLGMHLIIEIKKI